MRNLLFEFIIFLQCCILCITDARSSTANTNLTTSSIAGGIYFDKSVSPNITVIINHTANLNCRILNLENKTVVWVRHRDIHLLTSAIYTYTSDVRFKSIHNRDTDVWSLEIKNVTKADTGYYECQVGTTPAVGIPIYLSVVEPITTVLGGPDLYINAGSTINLTCIVCNLPIPPSYIIWTHNNNEEINFDSPRGGVSVITEKGDITTSYLYIQRARHSDNGEYKCSPSNANNVTVKVHVLNDEQSAAVQQISNGQHKIYQRINFIVILIFISVFN